MPQTGQVFDLETLLGPRSHQPQSFTGHKIQNFRPMAQVSEASQVQVAKLTSTTPGRQDQRTWTISSSQDLCFSTLWQRGMFHAVTEGPVAHNFMGIFRWAAANG